MQNLILQNAIWYVFCDIIIDNKLYVIMDIFVYLTLCFTSLFTLMDPLGVMPVFLQMTDGNLETSPCLFLKKRDNLDLLLTLKV